MIGGKTVQDILYHPEDLIESRKYFSWERFFTVMLAEYTKDTYLQYNKSKLKKAYLHEKIKQAILEAVEEIEWDA